jgi:hypothetical protein
VGVLFARSRGWGDIPTLPAQQVFKHQRRLATTNDVSGKIDENRAINPQRCETAQLNRHFSTNCTPSPIRLIDSDAKQAEVGPFRWAAV